MDDKILILKIKQFEGLRLNAYRDARGIRTIGYGHTGSVVSNHIDIIKANDLLLADLERCEKQLNSLKLSLSSGQRRALLDFIFNVGFGQFLSSTLLKRIKSHAPHEEIAHEFMKWVYCGERILPGLVERRKWEVSQWTQL